MASTLRRAVGAAGHDEHVDLMSAVLPDGRPCAAHLELDEKPHSHGDASFRYDITETAQGVRVVVSDIALDLSKPDDMSAFGHKFLKDEHQNWVYVPIFSGSLREFFSWSEKFDEDSDEAMQSLVEASCAVQRDA